MLTTGRGWAVFATAMAMVLGSGCMLFPKREPPPPVICYRMSDPAYRFPIASTYVWRVSDDDVPAVDAVYRERLHQDLRHCLGQALSRQGYRLVDDADQAQFYVRYHVATEGEETDRLMNKRYDPTARWQPHSVEPYDPGTVVVDIVDRRANRLVWRGAFRRELDPRQTPEEARALLAERSYELLNLFPPGMAGPGQAPGSP